MANHRMISGRIANSSKFLQMPAESQLLYFHMVIRADDDGVLESYPLLKLLGLAPDNFKVLLAKGYIRQLNEDQVIVVTDWLEHNKIRADRKIDSIYKPLLLERCPDLQLISPRPRSDVEDNSKRLGGLSTDGVSKDKLSKDKLSKDKLIGTVETPSQISKSFFSKDTHYEKCLEDFGKTVPRELLIKEFDKFILYWTELNGSGTKQRWQQQPTFDVKRRLVTWLGRVKQFTNGTKPRIVLS